jgi:hypothetical protein
MWKELTPFKQKAENDRYVLNWDEAPEEETLQTTTQAEGAVFNITWSARLPAK